MESLVVLAIIALVALFAVNIWFSVAAGTTTTVESHRSPAELEAIIQKCFLGVTWPRVEGRGQINRRMRTPFVGGPTVSVDLEPGPNGTEVSVWMSGWSGMRYLANFALPALLKKRKVVKAVLRAEELVNAR